MKKEFRVKLNYLRIAPRKVRLVADLIRNKSTKEALVILNFTKKRAAQPLTKLLKSAITNATNNFQLDPNLLYVSQIKIDEGPKLKRVMPRARGITSPIQKKTSHITIVLEIIEEKTKRKSSNLKKEIKERFQKKNSTSIKTPLKVPIKDLKKSLQKSF